MFSFTTTAKVTVAGFALAAAIAIPLAGATAASAADGCFPPMAVSDHYSVVQDTTLSVDAGSGTLSNDQSGGCADFVMNGATVAPEGDLLWGFDGSFDFIPAPGFVGTVHYLYRDSSSGGYSEYADIVIDVTAAPVVVPTPVANPDSYTTPQDTLLVVDLAGGLLANDTDVLSVFAQDNIVGQLNMTPAGDFTFLPPAGFVGTVTFNYAAIDGNMHVSNAAVVTIEVTPAVISIIPSIPVPGNPGDGTGTDGDLPTLAFTGTDDVAVWLIGPALALLALGGAGIWFARRRHALEN